MIPILVIGLIGWLVYELNNAVEIDEEDYF